MVAVSSLPCSYAKAWEPSNMDNAQVWLKGGTTSTTAGSPGKPDLVTTWTNQITSGGVEAQSFLQSDTGKMPTVGAKLNGIDSVEFDGSDNFLGAGDIATLDSLGTFMMAAVVKPTLDSNARSILSKGTGAADGSFSWRITGTGNNSKLSFVIFANLDNPENQVAMNSGATPFSSDTNNICLSYRTPSTAQNRINGADSGPAGSSDFMSATAGNVTLSPLLGEFSGGGCDPFDGLIYEIVVVSATALSGTPFSNLADIDSVEGYLAHRFALESNLPATHKYKKGKPWGKGRK